MGQKVNPISFRLGITENWRSRWYARKKEFGALVVADKKLRDFVKANYAFALISRVDVERTREEVRVTLFCGRPGVIIGRKGSEVDRLRSRSRRSCSRRWTSISWRSITLKWTLNSSRKGSRSSSASGPRSKRTVRKAAETTLDSGAKGVRIRISGRLGGAEMSRREMIQPRLDPAAHAARED